MQLVGCPGLLHGSLGCRSTRGHTHRGGGHQTSHGTEDLEREGGIEVWTGPGNLIPSTGTPPSHHHGERMEGPQTSVQLPPITGEQSPRSPWQPPQQRGHRSLPACSQQGVPGFGLASVPPTLKEMSTAYSLSCNKPQQNHHLPEVLFPRLCGRARSGPPPIAGLLAEESEEAGNAWEQQPSHRRARSRAATATGTRCGPRQRARVPGARGSGGSAARDGERR